MLINTPSLNMRILHPSFSLTARNNYSWTAYNQRGEMCSLSFLFPRFWLLPFLLYLADPEESKKGTEDRQAGEKGQKHSYSTDASVRCPRPLSGRGGLVHCWALVYFVSFQSPHWTVYLWCGQPIPPPAAWPWLCPWSSAETVSLRVPCLSHVVLLGRISNVSSLA